MARIDLHAVAELHQSPERVKETLCSLARVDRQVGSRGIADEQRITRQDEPRLSGPRAVDHGEAAVLGPMPGCVDASEHDLAEGDLAAVLENVVQILGLRGPMDADREPVLERKPPVTGEMVGVRVRLQNAHEADITPLGLAEVLLDRERRVDDDGLARALVSDEVRRASESVVDELREDHSESTVPPVSAIALEVCGCDDGAPAARSRLSRREQGLPRSPR